MEETRKTYQEMTIQEIKNAVREIRKASSRDQIRCRMVTELSYPYDPTTILISSVKRLDSSIIDMVSFIGPKEKILQV